MSKTSNSAELFKRLSQYLVILYQVIVVLTMIIIPFLAARPLNISELVGYYYVPYLVGVIYLVTGLLLISLRRTETAAHAFAMLAGSSALVMAGLLEQFAPNNSSSVNLPLTE